MDTSGPEARFLYKQNSSIYSGNKKKKILLLILASLYWNACRKHHIYLVRLLLHCKFKMVNTMNLYTLPKRIHSLNAKKISLHVVVRCLTLKKGVILLLFIFPLSLIYQWLNTLLQQLRKRSQKSVQMKPYKHTHVALLAFQMWQNKTHEIIA